MWDIVGEPALSPVLKKEWVYPPPLKRGAGGLGGISPTVIEYNRKLKGRDRRLRTQMTDRERALWETLRRKQVQAVQFYRQKP